MLLCLLATAQAATPTRTTVAKPQLLPTEAWDRIRTGRVHVARDIVDATLAQRLRADAPGATCGAPWQRGAGTLQGCCSCVLTGLQLLVSGAVFGRIRVIC